MAVYVDNMRAKFGRMILCHMIADTTEELLQMVDKIGVKPDEHFDISLVKRSSAIFHGAIEITWRPVWSYDSKKKNGRCIR